MIAGRNKTLKRYRVIVLGMKPKKGAPPPDDIIIVKDKDVFYGFSYHNHVVGKYFDLWFTNCRDDDPENFVTLGRITRIEPPYHGSGAIYVTRMGRFYIQETPCDVSVQGSVANSRSAASVSGRSLVKPRACSSKVMHQGNTVVEFPNGSKVSLAQQSTPDSIQGVECRSTRIERSS